jgi:Family of unknown function (DUF6325)
MTVGPIEYMLLTYGEDGLEAVVPEIARLVDSGTIRILDLAVITKDDDGDIEIGEYDEADGLANFASLDGEVGGLISQEDAEYAGEVLDPGSSAVMLVWEDPWAAPLFDAFRASGVVLLEGGRVPDDIAAVAVEALSTV